jgi:hypothetical protein
MGLGVIATAAVLHADLAVVAQPMLAQLVLPWETQPAWLAQAVVDAQADLQPFALPCPHKQPLPSAPQRHPLTAAQDTLFPKQLFELALAHAVLLESAQAVLQESVAAQRVWWQENVFAPVLQPGNPANSSTAVGARAIHRLKAVIRNTPLDWSSRHSVQNLHAGAIRAKTGN